ncbi:MAG: RHS repeat-associated core domain-containing protein [Opitutales bacterium]
MFSPFSGYRHTHILRYILPILFALLCVGLPGTLLANRGPSDSSGTEDDGNEEELSGCDSSSGSDNGSVSFAVPFPILPLEEDLGGRKFHILESEPSPLLFTPASLNHTSRAFTYVSAIIDPSDLPEGFSHEFEITNIQSEPINFLVRHGSSIGVIGGEFTGSGEVAELLDSSFAPTQGVPAYYRVYLGSGGYIDYPANRGATPDAVVTQSGRSLNLSTGKDEIFDVSYDGGAFRQIRSPYGLADIVVVDDFGYEIRFYTPGQVLEKAGGEYPVNGEPYRVIAVRNPTGQIQNNSIVRITDTHGDYESVSQWTYVSGAEEWVMSSGYDAEADEFLLHEYKTAEEVSPEEKLVLSELLDSDLNLVQRKQALHTTDSNGKVYITVETESHNEENYVTTYDYYFEVQESESESESEAPDSETDSGSDKTLTFGKLKSVEYPNGSWERYVYDEANRRSTVARPWLDSAFSSTDDEARLTEYSYVPVHPLDILNPFDSRPRTTIEYTLGIETGRAYNAFFVDSITGEYTEIMEVATVAGAQFGDSANLRTKHTYYPISADAASAGRLKTVETPDGVVRIYSYGQATSSDNFIETVDTVGVDGPVNGKSMRIQTTRNTRGLAIAEASYVYALDTWNLLSTTFFEYTDEVSSSGAQLKVSRKDGRVLLEQSWSGPNIASVIDAFGVETHFFYDPLDRLEREVKIGAEGREDIVTTYNRTLGAIDCGCDGKLSIKRTAGGLTLEEKKDTDSVGRLSSTQTIDGYQTSYSYFNYDLETTETLPTGETRTTSNHLDGQLKATLGSSVIHEFYTYEINSDGHRIVTVSIGTQNSPRYKKTTYDFAGRLISETTPTTTGGTYTRTYTYDERGLLVTQSEPGLASTVFEYDSLANSVRTGLDVDGDGVLQLLSVDRITDNDTFFEQDASRDNAWYEVSTVTTYPDENSDRSVIVSRMAEKSSGFTLATEHGDLVSETIARDIHGNETVVTTYAERSTKTAKAITNSPGSTIDSVRTVVNTLLISENSHTSTEAVIFYYDALDRPTGMLDPRNAQPSRIIYVPRTSLVASEIDAAQNLTTYTYYPQNSLGAGLVHSVTDALGKKSFRAYDELGREEYIWGETVYPQRFTYDEYGQTETLSTWREATYDPLSDSWPGLTGGDTTTWDYNAATGLLMRKEYADGKGTDYTYNASNRLEKRVWARGIITTYVYDQSTGELLLTDYSDTTPDVTNTYDRMGRSDTVTDTSGLRTYAYRDADLLLESETLPHVSGHVLERRYTTTDQVGRLEGTDLDLSGAHLHTYSYAYTSHGQLDTVSDASDIFTYQYHPQYGHRTGRSGGKVNVTYTYEANRMLKTQVANTDTSGQAISTYSYSYDALARRDSRSQSGLSQSTDSVDVFEYNDRSELEGWERFSGLDPENPGAAIPYFSSAYTYDELGNRKTSAGGYPAPISSTFSATYMVNALNQYDEISNNGVTQSPEYDLDGNLLNDGKWSYVWSAENRLIGLEPTSAIAGDQRFEYAYDAMGRRFAKETYTMNSQGGWSLTEDRRFVYDSWNLIAEYVIDASLVPQPATFHTWGLDLRNSMQEAGGIGGLLKTRVIEDSSLIPYLSSLYYPAHDANGNITEYLDESGNIAQSTTYSPFGRTLDEVSPSGFHPSFGFSSKYRENESGLLYYGLRYYDPETGRWLSRDPTGELGGLNLLYGFVGNDPLNLTDAFGLLDCETQAVISEVLGILTDLLMELGPDILDAIIPGAGLIIQALSGDIEGAVIGLAIEAVAGLTLAVLTGGGSILARGGLRVLLNSRRIFGALSNAASRVMDVARRVLNGPATNRVDNIVPCFIAGTLVATPNGDVEIQDIEVGDIVYAYNFETGEVVEQEILQTYKNFTYYWVDIDVGDEVITATRKHRFWVESEETWIPAIDLKEGMSVLSQNGEELEIFSVNLRQIDDPQDTFNLEVEGDHNYFVGTSGTLVHNGYPESPQYPPPTQVGENFQFNFDDSPGRRNSRSAGVRRAQQAGNIQPGEIGHHINSVQSHPHLAAEPDNIEGIQTEPEHRARHGGNYRNPTSGPLRTPGC